MVSEFHWLQQQGRSVDWCALLESMQKRVAFVIDGDVFSYVRQMNITQQQWQGVLSTDCSCAVLLKSRSTRRISSAHPAASAELHPA